MQRYSNKENVGINAVEKVFLELNWIPRRILQDDVGIDMHVEICENGHPTGQLIAVQVKSGVSYFKHCKNDQVSFRGSLTHLDYWSSHSLPVILVLHNPITGLIIWEAIKKEKVINSDKSWKIDIPTKQELSPYHGCNLTSLFEKPLSQKKLDRLKLDKSLIQSIYDEVSTFLEIEHWVNKSIGRMGLKIIQVSNFDQVETIREEGYIFFKGIKDIEKLFPWAELSTDWEYYEEFDDDIIGLNQRWDSIDKEIIYHGSNWREKLGPKGVKPISTGSGEIDFYRFEMTLNEIGKSFILLENYINS